MKAIAIALLSNAQRSQLVWLALGGNQITDRGAEHLAVALKLQYTIREDPLQGEGEGSTGGETGEERERRKGRGGKGEEERGGGKFRGGEEDRGEGRREDVV